MKIYLLDKNRNMTDCWKSVFKNEKDVEVVNQDFMLFMKLFDVECVVSPANSFGLMDGGFDGAITNFFGRSLMKQVQQYIIENYNGEQPVGTAFVLDILGTNKKLIHAPTMRVPSLIKDPTVVYFATRETLRVAKQNNVSSIVIPAFGGNCGGLDFEVIAKMMKFAFDEYDNIPEEINWSYAYRIKEMNNH